MTTRSAMVGANNSCACCSASAFPKSMKITCRPDSSSVSGPNMGCSEVTRQPALTNASKPGAQRRLERAQIEYQSARRAPRQRLEQFSGRGQRSGQHDQVEIQRIVLPIGNHVEPGEAAHGIGDGDTKPLRGQKLREPAAHLAVAADDQGAFAAAMRLGRHAGVLLRRQRGLNELPQQRFGQIGRDLQALGGVAAAQNDLALAAEVPGRPVRWRV